MRSMAWAAGRPRSAPAGSRGPRGPAPRGSAGPAAPRRRSVMSIGDRARRLLSCRVDVRPAARVWRSTRSCTSGPGDPEVRHVPGHRQVRPARSRSDQPRSPPSRVRCNGSGPSAPWRRPVRLAADVDVTAPVPPARRRGTGASARSPPGSRVGGSWCSSVAGHAGAVSSVPVSRSATMAQDGPAIGGAVRSAAQGPAPVRGRRGSGRPGAGRRRGVLRGELGGRRRQDR